MKTLFLFLCGLAFFTSCESTSNETKVSAEHIDSRYVGYKTLVLDGCEYWERGKGTTYAFTHKGTCPNPIHNK